MQRESPGLQNEMPLAVRGAPALMPGQPARALCFSQLLIWGREKGGE